MAKKLFVGGLAWGTTDDGLRMAFEKYGEVSEAKVVKDKETGRSRGFGFVTFNDDQNAVSAMGEMNGSQLEGRSIKVTEAQERARSEGSGPRGPSRSGPRRSF